MLEETEGDISWSWYVIAEGHSGQYVTIDLSPERNGLCYNSLWELHPGNSTIIAESFTDFLNQTAHHTGETWYWDSPSYLPIGQAYPD
jgi:hypothetical protein